MTTYTVSAKPTHVDGQVHWAWAINASLRGHPGGATCWKSVKGTGVVRDSMSVNETMALLVILRHVQEVAGLDPFGDAVEDIIPGSDVPTPNFVRKDLVKTLSHNHKAADMASTILTQQYPPTWIGEDNQGAANVVNHVSAQSKNLERITRVNSHVMSLIDEKLKQVELIAADKQEADQLSTPCISPLDEWRKNADFLECHPDITAILKLVNKKFNKSYKSTSGSNEDTAQVKSYYSHMRPKRYPPVIADQEELSTAKRIATASLMRFYDENL